MLKNKADGYLPKISFVICTLNCKDYLKKCLASIRAQDYPKNKVEIVIVDSYSDDGTIELARSFGARVILTKIRGYMEGKGMPKAIGCEKARGEIIITIDSDNSLVEKDWIRKMIFPLLNNPKIDYSICRMAIVKSDPIVNQYLSYVGTDPFAIYASLDPQISYGSVNLEDKGQYLIYHNTKSDFLITGGYYLAFRKKTLKEVGGYTRDVDVAYTLASRESGANIAIPKDAHLHHLITTGIYDFYKKKVKWGKYYFSNPNLERKHNWNSGWFGRYGKINFLFQAMTDVLVIPAIFTSIIMLIKYKDSAWLLHPLMKFLTVFAYVNAYFSVRLFSSHK